MQIQCYLYANVVEVQIWDSTIFSPRNRVVYSRPIKVYQGIDNPLQIVVKNQDQKSVNITGYLMQLDIQDPLAKGSVESLAVEITDFTKGYGTVTIPRDVVNSLALRKYKLTMKLIEVSSNKERPLYMDDNFTAPIDLEVLPGWYESMPLTLDSDEVLDAGTI
jgi:uncharacterized protein YukJ